MTGDGQTLKVTNEPEGIVCGQSVHRNEFGISKGTFWNPAGDLLAFYRMNESMVTPYPLVDITTRIALVDKIRYPMAGMLSHQVKVGIYNPATQKTIYLDMGDPNCAGTMRKAESCNKCSSKRDIPNMWSRNLPFYSCHGTATSSSIKASVTASTIYTYTIRKGNC